MSAHYGKVPEVIHCARQWLRDLQTMLKTTPCLHSPRARPNAITPSRRKMRCVSGRQRGHTRLQRKTSNHAWHTIASATARHQLFRLPLAPAVALRESCFQSTGSFDWLCCFIFGAGNTSYSPADKSRECVMTGAGVMRICVLNPSIACVFAASVGASAPPPAFFQDRHHATYIQMLQHHVVLCNIGALSHQPKWRQTSV